jgi:hypothetical protein
VYRHTALFVLLGAGLVDTGCNSDDDVDDGDDDTDEPEDTDLPTGPATLEAEITPDGMPPYAFVADVLIGVAEQAVIALSGSDVPSGALLGIAVPGSGRGTYTITTRDEGHFSDFEDTTTFSEEEGLFTSTSGTLIISRWQDTEFTEEESWYADGTFDITYTNESDDNPNPPITLEAVGEFANVVMGPLPTR